MSVGGEGEELSESRITLITRITQIKGEDFVSPKQFKVWQQGRTNPRKYYHFA